MQLRPFRLERFFAEHEFRAPYLLCASDCETVTIAELLALEPGAEARFHAQRLGYTDSRGAPELREEIARGYTRIQPDQVLVHAGAQEAILGFMSAVLRPGDHVVVHTPAYQSLSEVARASGCRITAWPAREEDGWAPDVEFLRRALRDETRAVVLNTPHNPTGYLMERARFEEVLSLAAARGILVFSDEVYRGLEHEPAQRLPAACDLYENAVSLGVLSKTYGLAGLRVGWVATRSRAVYEAMAAFRDYATICGSAPSEFLATLALRHRERLAARNLEIVRENVRRVEELFARYPERFRWQAPRAGSVAFPRYLGPEGSERFCAGLLEGAGVLLLPGSLFEAGDAHFRIGLGRRDLAAGLEQLGRFLAAAPLGR